MCPDSLLAYLATWKPCRWMARCSEKEENLRVASCNELGRAPAAHINLEQYRDQFLLQLLVPLHRSDPHARHSRRQGLPPPSPRRLGFEKGSPLSEVTALANRFGQSGGNDLSAERAVYLCRGFIV